MCTRAYLRRNNNRRTKLLPGAGRGRDILLGVSTGGSGNDDSGAGSMTSEYSTKPDMPAKTSYSPLISYILPILSLRVSNARRTLPILITNFLSNMFRAALASSSRAAFASSSRAFHTTPIAARTATEKAKDVASDVRGLPYEMPMARDL